MKLLVTLALLISSFAQANYRLSNEIHKGNSVEFIKHEGTGQWDNYLAMNLPFEPMEKLFVQLQSKNDTQLTNRGEAHITVITPIEYWDVLRPQGISMSEITELGTNANIQNAKFDIVCLGQGSALVKDITEYTYYVVVESDDLIQIRKKIQEIFVSKGGDVSAFNPLNFYPHITLGYTKEDLHESNGVIKDSKSCVSIIEIIQ